MSILITEEMRIRASEETIKRNPHITHHFDVNHLTGKERDIIGFLGEFACCEYLGIDWRTNIREDYITYDSGDISIGDVIVDVKTETIPQPFFDQVVHRQINDDWTYGRRLITNEQVGLLEHYDYVFFGGFVRDNYTEWQPFGYARTQHILENYEVVNESPNGKHYPIPGLAVRTSELHNPDMLIEMLNIARDNNGRIGRLWAYNSRGYKFYHSDRNCISIRNCREEDLEIFHLEREAGDEKYSQCRYCN